MGEDRKTIREHYRRLIDSSVAPSLTGDVRLWEGQMTLPIFLAGLGRVNLRFVHRLPQLRAVFQLDRYF